ncbi:MAG: hypothetical protein ACC707_03010 [Thiohalomonadales bacterium]
MKNLIIITACSGIVALSWWFYSFAGEYVVSIILTIVLISILVKPVKSKFSDNKKPKER